jgi:hypothetical protein
MAAFVAELPWGRFGTVDEIADVVVPRLERARVVGTCVTVDGGSRDRFKRSPGAGKHQAAGSTGRLGAGDRKPSISVVPRNQLMLAVGDRVTRAASYQRTSVSWSFVDQRACSALRGMTESRSRPAEEDPGRACGVAQQVIETSSPRPAAAGGSTPAGWTPGWCRRDQDEGLGRGSTPADGAGPRAGASGVADRCGSTPAGDRLRGAPVSRI